MITGNELKEWWKQGATFTAEEYKMLKTIVRESIEVMVNSYIGGSDDFQKAFELEIDNRFILVSKLNYLWVESK